MEGDQAVPQGPINVRKHVIVRELGSARERVDNLLQAIKKHWHALGGFAKIFARHIGYLKRKVCVVERIYDAVEESKESTTKRLKTMMMAQSLLDRFKSLSVGVRRNKQTASDCLKRNEKKLEAVRKLLENIAKNGDQEEEDDEEQSEGISESGDEEEDEVWADISDERLKLQALERDLKDTGEDLEKVYTRIEDQCEKIEATSNKIKTENNRAEQSIRNIEEVLETSLKSKVDDIQKRLTESSEDDVNLRWRLQRDKDCLEELATRERTKCQAYREVIHRFQSYSADLQKIVDGFGSEFADETRMESEAGELPDAEPTEEDEDWR